MSPLICGSLAYDTIMTFHDRFGNHILPDQIHLLNLSFLVSEMRREFGGCAGNIAYNLKLLGDNPKIMSTVGNDAGAYLERLKHLGLSCEYVRQFEGSYTPQAFITTDLDGNQINFFHPGAMALSHLNRISDTRGAVLAIVSPDGREGMLDHAEDLAAARIPFVFDPGQGTPMFSGDEILRFIDLAQYACFNEYEAKLVVERTGLSLEVLGEKLEALVVTLGADGSRIYTGGCWINIPCAPTSEILDPTGCGDAYRAGLLYGIARDWDWEHTGRLAAVMAAFKISCRGGQNHAPSRDEIAERFAAAFGKKPW